MLTLSSHMGAWGDGEAQRTGFFFKLAGIIGTIAFVCTMGCATLGPPPSLALQTWPRFGSPHA